MKRMSKGKHLRHEDWSVAIFNHLLSKNEIYFEDYGLTTQDQLFITEIISGTAESARKGRTKEKFYLYDIVNNSRSGLDVDKLDYFLRDIRHTNVNVNCISFHRFFDCARVMRAQTIYVNTQYGKSSMSIYSTENTPNPKIKSHGRTLSAADVNNIEGQYMICYPEKIIQDAVSLFAMRYNLHQKVYTHKSVKKVEFMVSCGLFLKNRCYADFSVRSWLML
jgi:HD superfamily phosphohydrolase